VKKKDFMDLVDRRRTKWPANFLRGNFNGTLDLTMYINEDRRPRVGNMSSKSTRVPQRLFRTQWERGNYETGRQEAALQEAAREEEAREEAARQEAREKSRQEAAAAEAAATASLRLTAAQAMMKLGKR